MQNTTADVPKYKNLIVTGDISIEPVPANEKISKRSRIYYLIMGPTGAGKSSFIEALAGSAQKLEISKDQLAGYTQRVQAYHLTNVIWGSSLQFPIYLIDTPGFSDTKISETEVIDMLRAWLDENNLRWFDRIIFFTPITQPRLAGSKRRTIAMLSALLKPTNYLNAMTFVTSMWDQVHSERAEQRAEAHFAQPVRDVILKEFVDAGSSVTRFRNTRDSALQVLNTANVGFNAITLFSHQYKGLSHLYHDLHERIEGALHLKSTLESDLATPHAQDNIELQSILRKNHTENEETLRKFVGQLVGFGDIPRGYQRAGQDLRRRIVEEVVPVDSDQAKVFESWAQEPDIPFEGLQGQPDSLHPGRLPALKGLMRRLMSVAKRGGNKSFNRRA